MPNTKEMTGGGSSNEEKITELLEQLAEQREEAQGYLDDASSELSSAEDIEYYINSAKERHEDVEEQLENIDSTIGEIKELLGIGGDE